MKTDEILLIAALGLGAIFLLKKPVQDITEPLGGTLQGVATGVGGLGSGISTASTGVGSGISDAFRGVGSGIGTIGREAGETVGAFSDLFQKVFQRGTSFVGGSKSKSVKPPVNSPRTPRSVSIPASIPFPTPSASAYMRGTATPSQKLVVETFPALYGIPNTSIKTASVRATSVRSSPASSANRRPLPVTKTPIKSVIKKSPKIPTAFKKYA